MNDNNFNIRHLLKGFKGYEHQRDEGKGSTLVGVMFFGERKHWSVLPKRQLG